MFSWCEWGIKTGHWRTLGELLENSFLLVLQHSCIEKGEVVRQFQCFVSLRLILTYGKWVKTESLLFKTKRKDCYK